MTKRFSINSFQLKVLALILMTVDHIGSFQVLTLNRQYNDLLRVVGRAAAPLFMFLIVEGLRHTRSKPKYLLRLYLAGVIIEMANRVMLRTVADGFMDSTFGNILPTFAYVALYVICIEQIINYRGDRKRIALGVCGLVAPLISVALNIILLENSIGGWQVIGIIFPSPFTVEYSFLFVCMGITWYFVKNKYINTIILSAVSLLSLLIPASSFFTTDIIFLQPIFFNAFSLFIDSQWCMVLAAPFIMLYNGEKGRSFKYFFYVYYPLHQYLFFILAHFIIRTNGQL